MLKNWKLMAVAALAAVAGCSPVQDEYSDAGSDPQVTGHAKYVFLFIGDGMGLPQISAAEAYGPVQQTLFIKITRAQCPPENAREKGKTLSMTSPEGQKMYSTIADVAEDHIVLDANHPLAGQDLVFDIELLSID